MDEENSDAMETIEVIVLDDEEMTQSKEIKTEQKSACINPNCKNGNELIKPTLFSLSYYRINGRISKDQTICRECYDEACDHFNQLTTLYSEGSSLLKANFPNIAETYTLDSDSDEESADSMPIDEESSAFISENLDDAISEVMNSFQLNAVINNTLTDLSEATLKKNAQIQELVAMTSSIRKGMDEMIYNLTNILPTNAAPAAEVMLIEDVIGQNEEIEFSQPSVSRPLDLPNRGTLVKPSLACGRTYYVKRSFIQLMSWTKAVLMDVLPTGTNINDMVLLSPMFRVSRSRDVNEPSLMRLIDGRSIAYAETLPMLLEIGTRVIAAFRTPREKVMRRDMYFQGIVGEFPSALNYYRYLIFFDDGYALYVHHNHVYPVYESSHDVWEDVTAEARPFIKKYLSEYPNRSMVKLEKGQHIRTEYRGKWYDTTVADVDCSLVQMYFLSMKRVEWIYRGSRRLKTMYQEAQVALNHPKRNARARNRPVTGAPYVQYSSVQDDGDVVFVSQGPAAKPTEARGVARKSTKSTTSSIVQQPQRPPAPTQEPQGEDNLPGKMVFYTPRKQSSIRKLFSKHKCGKKCKELIQTPLTRLVGYGPLAKPLICGFNRLEYKPRSRKPFVVYKTPCGKTVRNMEELHQYLLMTESELAVDLFNFDSWVRCLVEFVVEEDSVLNKDFSNGQEPMNLPIANYLNNKMPDLVKYSTKRIPMQDVNLNLDPEFLCSCDCVDDCRDKTKCSCWKLTLEGAKYLDKNPDEIGYVYRRLFEPVVTGIYECNSRCKCAKTCLNRVAQNPLQHKLQIFMTKNRGWGVRCLNDIPRGTFICVYAGCLLTDEMANVDGANSNDEYYAELDFIETAEQVKQDYEEEAYSSSEESNVSAPHTTNTLTSVSGTNTPDTNADSQGSNDASDASIRNRLRKRDSEINYGKLNGEDENMSDDEENGREPSSFNPKVDSEDNSQKQPSVRNMYGDNDSVFIMDAKNTGNLGRFLNHSCTPNVIVQNVFVDTHDLRFPWVAFFANQYIQAATELTWNYNYEVGSVVGKVLLCSCGSRDCKGRLL